MFQIYFMLKDISERNMSCILPELTCSYNNTYVTYQENIPKTEGSLNTNQNWKIWNKRHQKKDLRFSQQRSLLGCGHPPKMECYIPEDINLKR